MNILFVNNGLAGGGAEKLINDLLPLLNVEHKCDLLILSDKDEKYLTNLKGKGVKVYIVPESIKGHIQRIRYLASFIKNGDYDLVHANEFPVIYYCSLIKKTKIGKKFFLFMTEHNTYNRRRRYGIFRPIEQFIYSSYNHVISISEQTQTALISWLKTKHIEKFTVIENGIPLHDFFNAEAYNRKDFFHPFEETDTFLCMVGSFTEQKNHKLILEVMERLPRKYKLVLLGEGPLKNEIEAMTELKKLQDRIYFMGFRKDVPQIMKTTDILVIPSKWEGFGLIAVEGMASGMQIVASDIPGLSEVVGKAGIKVSPITPEGFAKAIQMLSEKPIDKSIIVKQAEKYDIVIMQKKYLDLYKTLV